MSNSVRARKANYQIYNQLYSELPLDRFSDRFLCFYCGQNAGTVDHQPPLSVIGSMLTSGMSFDCVLVPCCHSCNSHLGALPTITLSERFEALKNILRAKYRKELRLQGQWTLDEILELGPGLRSMVIGSVNIGLDAEERILYQGHRLKNPKSIVRDGLFIECPDCGHLFADPDTTVCSLCGSSLR